MPELRPPDLSDVLSARRVVGAHLPRTPLYRYPALDDLIGTEVWVKHENHLPTGAFKVRGGVNLMARLGDSERAAGVISASTGNHGQSIAFAAQLFGVRSTICVPEGANPTKIASMESYGANIVVHGRDFDDARERAATLAAEHGYRYVHSGNEPHLIAGVGTYALEVLEDLPDVDAIVVPIGGGSGAAGTCIVAKTVRPQTEVIGVQAEAAPAAYRSWKERTLVEDEMKTASEGLATRTAFELPQRILWELLDDFVLVDEEALVDATYKMITMTRNLVESAGAAALAAALALTDPLAGKRVCLICSGANISPGQLREVLEERA